MNSIMPRHAEKKWKTVRVHTRKKNFYGIPDVRLIKAVGFDIEGADEAQILREAIDNIKAMDIGKQ